MIELKSTCEGTYYVVDHKDIVGLNTWSLNDKAYYNIIVKWSQRWIPVEAETFFKVKTMLESRAK